MAAAPICVDASFVLRLVVGPDDAQAWELFSSWTSAGRRVAAPGLLAYEVINTLHRYHRAGYLSPASAEAEFWTADRKLVAAVQDKLPWVHGVT